MKDPFVKNISAKDDYGVNIGLSSLLLVFTVLCLVSFATLSIASASADKRLNDKVTENTAAYYSACNKAEDKLASIGETLYGYYRSGMSDKEYFDKTGKKISFTVQVSDTQTLNVELSILYPSDKSGPFYKITKWKIENTASLDLDTDLPVPQ